MTIQKMQEITKKLLVLEHLDEQKKNNLHPLYTKKNVLELAILKTSSKKYIFLKNSFLLSFQVLKNSPSSSEGALTSLRPEMQLKIKRQFTTQPGMPTVDRFLSHLGDPGRYQVIIMILMAANCIPVVVNHLLMAFYVPFKRTSHNCRVSIFVYIHEL